MRLEHNITLFVVFLLIVVSIWFVSKKQNGSKATTKILLVLTCSLTLPAFIPGHGEIIVALPNAALFGKFTTLTIGVGLFYVFIYSCFLFLIFGISNGASKQKN